MRIREVIADRGRIVNGEARNERTTQRRATRLESCERRCRGHAFFRRRYTRLIIEVFLDRTELGHAIGPRLQRCIATRIGRVADIRRIGLPARNVRGEFFVAGIEALGRGRFFELLLARTKRRTIDVVIAFVEGAFVKGCTHAFTRRRASGKDQNQRRKHGQNET